MFIFHLTSVFQKPLIVPQVTGLVILLDNYLILCKDQELHGQLSPWTKLTSNSAISAHTKTLTTTAGK